MDLLDVIAIDVVREAEAKGRKVLTKVIAHALGVHPRSAGRRLRSLQKDGILPPKKKARRRVPLEPFEKARRAAQRERRRRVLERQAMRLGSAN